MAYNPGFAGLVARKYQLQEQQANTAERLANANVGYLGAETAAYPAEAAARAFATRAGGQTSQAQANLFNANASLAPWLAGSEVNERNAAAADSTARAGLTRYQTTFNPDITQAGTDRFYGPDAPGGSLSGSKPFSYATPGVTDLSPIGLPSAGPSGVVSRGSPTATVGTPASPSGFSFSGGNDGSSTNQIGGTNTGSTSIYSGPGNNVIGGAPVRQAYSEGTSKVPGKGTGKVDTQPAMLAPGEAVLNRGAAEHLGRDTISLLNAIGARRMGLTVGSDSDTSTPATGSNDGVANQTGAPDSGPHYAGGTPDVKGAYPYGTPQHPMDESSATPQTSWPRTPADDPFDQGQTPHYAGGTSDTTSTPQRGRDTPSTYGDPRMGDNTFDWRTGSSPQMGPSPWQNDRDRTPLIPGYAWGTDNVGGPPAPGQTTSNGSWTPPAAPFNPRAATGITGVPRPTPPQGTGQAKPPGYAKGTSNVPGKGGKGAAKPADSKGKGGGKMSPHAAAHTPDGSGISPGIIEALMSMGGMGGGAAGAPRGAMPGMGAGTPPPTGPVGGIPPAGAGMAPVSLPPMPKKRAA